MNVETKGQSIISYNGVIEYFGLHTESGFHYFDIAVGDDVVDKIHNRSIMLTDAVLVWICRQGSIVISVNGVSHTFSAGQMLVVFAQTYSRINTITSDFAASIILGRISSEASVDSIIKTFPRVSQMPVVSLLKQENATLTALMNYIDVSSHNYRCPSRGDIDNNILAILRAEMIDIFLRRNLAAREATEDEQLVKRFNMMLAVSSFEHRDVEYYASECNLHPKRFAVKVKRITGTTPSDLIASAVIKNAKRLLVSTELGSHEIAEKLNFSTPSFFCRYFKRYVGKTPQEWRDENSVF